MQDITTTTTTNNNRPSLRQRSINLEKAQKDDNFNFNCMKELSVQQCIHIVHTFNIVNRGNGRCNSMQAYSLPADVEERAYNVVGRDVAIPADLTK